jgi:hypothetical protein
MMIRAAARLGRCLSSCQALADCLPNRHHKIFTDNMCTSSVFEFRNRLVQSASRHLPTRDTSLPPACAKADTAYLDNRDARKPSLAGIESENEHKSEYVVDVKSFLLGSHVDLAKLKPKFQDVLRAQGKDYLVLGFRPVRGAGEPDDDGGMFSDTPPAPVPAEERAGARPQPPLLPLLPPPPPQLPRSQRNPRGSQLQNVSWIGGGGASVLKHL